MHDQNWRRRVEHKLDRLLEIGEKLLMTSQEELALLKAIDDATTTIGGNVQKVANDVQTISAAAGQISTEIDQLLANSNVPSDVADALNALKTKSDALQTAAKASSDALDAQVPVLQGIATKGAGTPVPVPVAPAVLAAQETTPMVDAVQPPPGGGGQ